MITYESNLKVLELSPNDLMGLSVEKREAKIKAQYRKMALKHHPDKNPDDPQQANENFKNLYAAYIALLIETTIHDTALSLLLEENIEAAYAALNNHCYMLHSEQEKKAFRDYYGRFINLASLIEKKRASQQENRSEEYKGKWDKYLTFRKNITYKWRNLIISLFAEEYLDDFKYRHALATGDFTDILATRKLLSPIKAIVALLNTIYLFLPMVIFAPFLLYNISLFFSIIKLWLGYKCIYGFLEFLASPVNNIVRPISEYSGISPLILTAAFLAIGAAGIYSSLVLKILKILVYAANDWPMVIGALIFSIIYDLYKAVINFGNITQILPLPIEPVPEHIQEAINLVSKKATLSHQLFNTPKDTEFLLQEERTFSQQTASFFGAVIHKTTPYKNFPILQLCYPT